MYTNYIFIQWLTKIRQNMFQANDEYKWSTWYGLFLHEQLSKRQVLRGEGLLKYDLGRVRLEK